MDFLNLTGRLRNAFAPSNPIDKYKYRNDNTNEDSDVLSTINRIYTPQHDYSDLYRQGLDQMPQRTEPGKLRSVFGVMAGLGREGAQAEEQVRYAPYYRQLGDWEARMKALQPGMTAERYGNTDERMLAHQAASDLLRQRDIERREKTDASNIEIRQGRAKAYADNLEFKNSHPKHDLKAIPGGNYVWFNPQDPSEDPVDTGIKSGTLSKIEEMNLAQRNALQRIGATGAEARKTEELRQTGRETLEDKRVEGRKEVKAAPSDTGTETITETEVTERDAQGNPVKAKRRTTKKPISPEAMHRMQYTDRNTGKPMMIRVPESKVKEAMQHGARDLGVIK